LLLPVGFRISFIFFFFFFFFSLFFFFFLAEIIPTAIKSFVPSSGAPSFGQARLFLQNCPPFPFSALTSGEINFSGPPLLLLSEGHPYPLTDLSFMGIPSICPPPSLFPFLPIPPYPFCLREFKYSKISNTSFFLVSKFPLATIAHAPMIVPLFFPLFLCHVRLTVFSICETLWNGLE